MPTSRPLPSTTSSRPTFFWYISRAAAATDASGRTVTAGALITSIAEATGQRNRGGIHRRSHPSWTVPSGSPISSLSRRSVHDTTPTTTSNLSTIGTALIRRPASTLAISATEASTGAVITSVLSTSRTCHCGIVHLLSGTVNEASGAELRGSSHPGPRQAVTAVPAGYLSMVAERSGERQSHGTQILRLRTADLRQCVTRQGRRGHRRDLSVLSAAGDPHAGAGTTSDQRDDDRAHAAEYQADEPCRRRDVAFRARCPALSPSAGHGAPQGGAAHVPTGRRWSTVQPSVDIRAA